VSLNSRKRIRIISITVRQMKTDEEDAT